MSRRPFLTAEWRHLALLSFEIDPSILRPLTPAGTELDEWERRIFVSVVGFLFLDTRVRGIAIPFHRNFEEVNLRFYVRRRAKDGWRRGVVFIRELVPRAAIAFAAKAIYGENYTAVPMRHGLDFSTGSQRLPTRVFYAWTFHGREHRLEIGVHGSSRSIEQGSHEEFIAEHYWGYTRRLNRPTLEYGVEHAPWRIWTADSARLDCDATELYGPQFVDCLQAAPASAFLADGSPVTVLSGIPLDSENG